MGIMARARNKRHFFRICGRSLQARLFAIVQVRIILN